MSTAWFASPFIKAQRVRGLAVTSGTRMPQLPDIPTVAEQGFPGYEVHSWWGLVAPVGVPQPVLNKIHVAIATWERLRGKDSAGALLACDKAIASCGGPLLPDPLFASCFEDERRRWHRRLVEAALYAAEGLADGGLRERVLVDALSLVPADEELALALLELYRARGHREAACVIYWDHRKALAMLTGLAPGPRIEAVYRQMVETANPRRRPL